LHPTLLLTFDRPKVSAGVKKNNIITKYKSSFKAKGITSQVSTSTNKSEIALTKKRKKIPFQSLPCQKLHHEAKPQPTVLS
jgi:hypothetical protein